eukprot:3940756-Rhodomonas_salina.4
MPYLGTGHCQGRISNGASPTQTNFKRTIISVQTAREICAECEIRVFRLNLLCHREGVDLFSVGTPLFRGWKMRVGCRESSVGLCTWPDSAKPDVQFMNRESVVLIPQNAGPVHGMHSG